MRYDIDNSIEDFYTVPYKDTREEALQKTAGAYQLKTIKSGDMLEAEIYPLLPSNGRTLADKARRERDYEIRRNSYEKQQRKYVIRQINTNFRRGDTWATFTYDEKHLPKTLEEAKRNMQNYIRRVQYACKRVKVPPLKYIYTTEVISRDGNVVRVHHHLVINVTDRDFLERKWNSGRAQTRSLQPDKDGLDGMATYILRASKFEKAYVCSLNLTKPTLTTADSKVSRRGAYAMASDSAYALKKLSRFYPGYEILSINAWQSDYRTGVYLYAKLIKRNLRQEAEKIDIIPRSIGHPKSITRAKSGNRTRQAAKKVSISDLKAKLKTLKGIDTQITAVCNECCKLPQRSPMRKIAERKLKESEDKLAWFDEITAHLPSFDAQMLRDKYVKGKKYLELQFKYHYSDKSAISRRIARLTNDACQKAIERENKK